MVAAAAFVAGCTNGPGRSQTEPPAVGTVESQSFAQIPGVVRRLEPTVVTVFAGKGSGSGVVYKADGIIVTNGHVVGQEDRTQVRFADGQQVSGAVIAKDEVTDLTLIRTDRKQLPAAKFATKLPAPGELCWRWARHWASRTA